MALNPGWFSSWYADSYFPSVWFAPADESEVPEEELRQDYRGGTGRMLPARDPFRDASDSDIERLVREKWETIEAAQAQDKKQDQAQDLEESAPEIKEALALESIAHDAPVNIANPLVLAKQASAPIVQDPAGAMLLLRKQDEAFQAAMEAARRRADDDAFILMLTEL